MTTTAEMFDRARALHTAGQLRAAEQLYRQVLDAGAFEVPVLPLLTAVYQSTGQFDEALACCRRSVALQPDNARAHYNLAVVLFGQNQLDEAIASFRQAAALEPSLAEAHNNLGVALIRQNKFDEAVASYREALRLKPDYVEALHNLARPLVHHDQLDEAIACCRRAIELRPDYADAHYRLGVALAEQNQLDEAIASYERTLTLRPGDAEAHLGLAIALLRLGRYDDAWPHYEWRLARADNPGGDLPHPRWTGFDLTNRTILLRSEQGLGDTLQFIRYAPLVKRQAARVIVSCAPALARVLARVEGVDAVVPHGEPLPPFDVQTTLLSLPAIFRTSLATIPSKTPYLACEAAAIERAKAELELAGSFNVGIAWQGGAANPRDRARSIPLEHFSGLARMAGVRLYSLQFGLGCEQLQGVAGRWPIVDLGDRLGDFDHTAAVMHGFDLIVTCDSAPAHLAGALGLPVWVALPFAADWRWLVDRTDSPWYPTMRLFRQQRRGDWAGVFQEIEQAVATLWG